MILSWSDLNVQDRARFRTASAFLKGRLEEPETVRWALRLRPERQVERTAIFELVAGPDAPQLREPYASAWPLILESWSDRTGASPASALLQIRRRLKGGDRSGHLIDEISNLAAPRLEVRPLQGRPSLLARTSRRPKKLSDLLSASLSSASLLINLRAQRIDIGLEEIADVAFLHALANALMSAVDRGLYIARRIYGGNERDWPAMASPLRVYFVPPEISVRDYDGPGGRVFDPDAVTRGIAPAVKLLHEVLERIAELDTEQARSILGRWRHSGIPIYRRLWAAAARNTEAVSSTEVGEFLMSLDDGDFWDSWSYPEFAELRAVRFSDFKLEPQTLIVKRLRRGPPRKLFPRKVESEEARIARRALAAVELRWIEVAGAVLQAQDRYWLLEAAHEFPGLKNMTIDGGFRDPWVRPFFRPGTSPKSRFDELEGETRLQALEDALSSETSFSEASNWLQKPARAVQVLRDLEAAASLVNRFSHVWDLFGHIHSQPASQPESETPRDAESEATRVLNLMSRLSDITVEAAIDGICQWLYMWSEHVIGSELGRQIWLRAWSSAVKLTNTSETGIDKGISDPTIPTGGEEWAQEKMDAFYLPVGKLLRVFLELFRFKEQIQDPFGDGSLLTKMRNTVIAAPGRSGLVAHCHLTRKLPDFLQVDPSWTMQVLVDPLLNDDDTSVLLWRALASTWIDSEMLKTIGDEASRRILDDRLGKEPRKSLVSCLVHEGLTAFRDRRDPSVSLVRISQTLRAADDEIREQSALEIRQFQEHAFKNGQGPRALGKSFLSAVKPFLERVWPQEKSFATSGVSRHLSCLPSISGTAFVEAVDEIERFLVPFDCRSMLEYGFYEGDMFENLNVPRLSDVVDNSLNAQAFLRLLDLTVGDSQDALIPDDLSTALGRVESEAPKLTTDPAFRRLAAAARG